MRIFCCFIQALSVFPPLVCECRREEHEDELRRALDKDIDKLDIFDRYTSHVRTRQRNGGPIIIVRAKYARLAQLMDAMSVEQLILMATLVSGRRRYTFPAGSALSHHWLTYLRGPLHADEGTGISHM